MTCAEHVVLESVEASHSDDALTVERLLMAMERLPAQPPVALRVVWACDDPRSDCKVVANALSLDPILAARVLRMANSVFYGVRSEVTNLARAVTVVGLAAVRAVATSCAARVDGRSLEGFWSHAAATGTACQLIAHRFGVPPNDAFTAGLLHDLGVAILDTAVPGSWAFVVSEGGGCPAENGIFGTSHPEVGGRVLGAWRLPGPLVDAVASHHQALGRGEGPLTRAVVVADALATSAGFGLQGVEADLSVLDESVLGLDERARSRLVSRIADEALELGAVLAS